MTIYYESELAHHGVKGMKWGVRKDRSTSTGSGRLSFRKRRLAKKQLKDDLKKTTDKARTDRDSDIEKLNSSYEKRVADNYDRFKKEVEPHKKVRDEALTKNKEYYESLKKTTDSFYKEKIDKHMNKALKLDEEANFWGSESNFGKEAAKSANEHLEKATKLESEYNSVKSKNSSEHHERIININATYDTAVKSYVDRYHSELDAATADYQRACSKRGQEYVDAVKNAKIEYKKSVKNLKSK